MHYPLLSEPSRMPQRTRYPASRIDRHDDGGSLRMSKLAYLLEERLEDPALPDDERVRMAVRNYLAGSNDVLDTEYIDHLTRITRHNLASGRAGRVMGQEDEPGIESYVSRVAAVYRREYDQIVRLAAGDHEAWRAVFRQLSRLAYRLLVKYGWSEGSAVEEAQDFAQTACGIIDNTPFTFDAPFDAWAALIVKNAVRQKARAGEPLYHPERTSALEQTGQRDDDEPPETWRPDESAEHEFARVEWQDWMVWVTRHLHSPAQRQVLLETLLEEYDDEEIARRLGRSRNAVQILRHRALHTVAHHLGWM